MPKGHRETALIDLVKKLDELDSKRRKLVAQIQQAATGLQSGGFTIPATRGRSGRVRRRRKGFKMSAEARAKIGAAQKKRWAKQKSGRQ